MDILSLEMTRTKYMQFLEAFSDDCRAHDDYRKVNKHYSYTSQYQPMVASGTERRWKSRKRPVCFPSTSATTQEGGIDEVEDTAEYVPNIALSQELVQSLTKLLPLKRTDTMIMETVLRDRTEPHSVAVIEMFLAQQIKQVMFRGGLATFDQMNHIMRHLFEDSSMGQYNWGGVQGKTSIQNSPLFMIIRDNACKGEPLHFHKAILHCRRMYHRRKHSHKRRK